MPVWDIIGFTRGVIKYGFFFALFIYIAGLSSLIGDIVISTWTMISSSVDAMGNALNGKKGKGAMSCIFYFAHEVGIDTALTSFFASLVGLGVFWASTVAHLLLLKFIMFQKELLTRSA